MSKRKPTLSNAAAEPVCSGGARVPDARVGTARTRKSGEPSRKGIPNRSREDRYKIFARLIINGGNVLRTSYDCGVTRENIFRALREHRDEYEEIKAEVKAALLAEVAEGQRLALTATLESLRLSIDAMRTDFVGSKIKAVDLARSVEIMARVIAMVGGDSASPDQDPADAGTTSPSDADVAAILGE